MSYDDWNAPPIRLRADQTGDEREERRPGDWSDLEGPYLLPDLAPDTTPPPLEASRAVPDALEESLPTIPPAKDAAPRRLAEFPAELVTRLWMAAMRSPKEDKR